MGKVSESSWESIKKHIDSNMELMDVLIEDDKIIYSFENPQFPGGRSNSGLRINKYTTTLGLDVKEYSDKQLFEQFLTSAKLFAFVEKSISWFEKNLSSASQRPDAIIPTGDGAYLFFGSNTNSLLYALNFLLLFNMYIHASNKDFPLIGATYDGLKIPLRYTIAMGDAIMMKDTNGSNNVVGDSIIKCSRVMSCDKDVHFLLESTAAENLKDNYNTIENGLQNYSSFLYNKVNFNLSDKMTKTIKGTSFSFYNVTANYSILDLKDSQQSERKKNAIDYVFEIGTSNLSNIDL